MHVWLQVPSLTGELLSDVHEENFYLVCCARWPCSAFFAAAVFACPRPAAWDQTLLAFLLHPLVSCIDYRRPASIHHKRAHPSAPPSDLL